MLRDVKAVGNAGNPDNFETSRRFLPEKVDFPPISYWGGIVA